MKDHLSWTAMFSTETVTELLWSETPSQGWQEGDVDNQVLDKLEPQSPKWRSDQFRAFCPDDLQDTLFTE